ncbi:MAG TPA: hypothetical protein VGO03_09945 [Acidimicrobiia bacterium]|jgi:hypothetical protein
MGFYGEVMQELVVALGAALLLANVIALVKRRQDKESAAQRKPHKTRPGSPVKRMGQADRHGDLAVAPLARTVTYALVGLVVMLWGVATIVK